jgi:hypothetical protein
MTAVTGVRPVVDAEARLKVWRERWQHAPTASARAHAQLAIDLWLDRLLDAAGGDLPLPAQRVEIDLQAPAVY